MAEPFDFLKLTNDWLEKYPVRIVASFGQYFRSGNEYTQDKVDIICRWLAWRVNIAIERRRQEVIKALYEMYMTTATGKVMQVAMAVQNFAKDPIKSVGDFAGAIFGPVVTVIKWVTMLAKELPRLAKNLAKIAQSLPPEPPSPYINYNAFKLKIKTVDMSTITSDPANLPAPEVMFPEPTRPWSKEAFAAEMNGLSNWKEKHKKKYELKEDNDLTKALLEKSNPNTDLPDSI